MFTYIFTEKMLLEMNQSLLVEISMLEKYCHSFYLSFSLLISRKRTTS